MANLTYPRDRTAYLLIDPYNDFLSEGGKAWPRVAQVATEVGLLDNLRALDAAVRAAGQFVRTVPELGFDPEVRNPLFKRRSAFQAQS